MYELLLFTGGIYKFNEFKEFIDDLGGLIIEMESFKISRGMYFFK
ncbi:methyl-coenzyme M reductase family protein [Methanobrevibacter arboriphilus]